MGEPNYSTNPVNFVASQEWFREKPYWDVNGWAIWFGQHSINGKPVTANDTISREAATVDLQNRVNSASYSDKITVPLNENQRAALYSFEHNLWWNIWNWDAKNIIAMINAKDFQWAANEMQKYINAGGKPLQWLIARRQEEWKLLLS